MASPIRNAFVLGAGLGTRLRPLTNSFPKPLIPVCQKPLITFAFDRLAEAGITNLVVNTHHGPGKYKDEFPDHTYQGLPIHFRNEPVLLETAGGIKNVQDLLDDEPFIVYNGDILTDLPIEPAIRHHVESGNEVTMVLRSKDGPLQVAYNDVTRRITDVGGKLGGASDELYLFTGIYIVDSAFLGRIPSGEKISVIPIFLDMIRKDEKIGGVVIDEGHWWDLGTREQYLKVHQFLSQIPFGPVLKEWPLWEHPTAEIHHSARITGATVIGKECRIGENVVLNGTILWPGAEIASGSVLENCIVTSGQHIKGVYRNADF